MTVEKMDEAEANDFILNANVKGGWIQEMGLEMQRARAEEARLTAEVTEKDAMIKVLVVALDDAATRKSPIRRPYWCTHTTVIPATEPEHGSLCVRWRAALRRAGVLK